MRDADHRADGEGVTGRDERDREVAAKRAERVANRLWSLGDGKSGHREG